MQALYKVNVLYMCACISTAKNNIYYTILALKGLKKSRSTVFDSIHLDPYYVVRRVVSSISLP